MVCMQLNIAQGEAHTAHGLLTKPALARSPLTTGSHCSLDFKVVRRSRRVDIMLSAIHNKIGTGFAWTVAPDAGSIHPTPVVMLNKRMQALLFRQPPGLQHARLHVVAQNLVEWLGDGAELAQLIRSCGGAELSCFSYSLAVHNMVGFVRPLSGSSNRACSHKLIRRKIRLQSSQTFIYVVLSTCQEDMLAPLLHCALNQRIHLAQTSQRLSQLRQGLLHGWLHRNAYNWTHRAELKVGNVSGILQVCQCSSFEYKLIDTKDCHNIPTSCPLHLLSTRDAQWHCNSVDAVQHLRIVNTNTIALATAKAADPDRPAADQFSTEDSAQCIETTFRCGQHPRHECHHWSLRITISDSSCSSIVNWASV
mmetsp:Transcript_125588/g.234879  ORF Transcript_125588/g.234879 Transcript_125588/m.234879 type:complete len:365 (-) Transcript_125588:517-1611(-)